MSDDGELLNEDIDHTYEHADCWRAVAGRFVEIWNSFCCESASNGQDSAFAVYVCLCGVMCASVNASVSY